MKILLLNQTFYPDVVSTAQHLSDLAAELAGRGHDVTALAGDHGYDDPAARFPSSETWRGVRIRRLSYTSFGKSGRLSRAVDFASFLANASSRLAFQGRYDVVVALTSPPMVAAAALAHRRLRGGRFLYWVMDLNPDEAIEAGWLKRDAAAARILGSVGRWTVRHSDRIVALDRFMKSRLQTSYGADPERVSVLPPWSHDDKISPVPRRENRFRREHGLQDTFVVMYSGNHSPCHPLDTVLAAAERLESDPGVVFCFVGGGSLVAKIAAFKREKRLENIRQFPYQPLDTLSHSLSAADMHVAVLGDPYVGILHPCKIYGILAAGRPFVYVGPAQSHIGDLLLESGTGWSVRHGDTDGFLAALAQARSADDSARRSTEERCLRVKDERFSGKKLCPEFANLVEKTAAL